MCSYFFICLFFFLITLFYATIDGEIKLYIKM